MAEKLEQTKGFIEEFNAIQGRYDTLYTCIQSVFMLYNDFPILDKWLFESGNSKNQLTFAKILAGEIELVEKKDKYVIYQVNARCISLMYSPFQDMINTSKWAPVAPVKECDLYHDSRAHFDQDFAFAMRDTGKFKIQKVVE